MPKSSFTTRLSHGSGKDFALAQSPRAFTLNRMNRKLALPLLAVALLGSIACGGEDESQKRSSQVKSGIDESKPLNTLTPAEAEQLGKTFIKTVEDSGFVEALCVFAGILGEEAAKQSGAMGVSCEELVEPCVEEAKADLEPTNQEVTQLATCTATVGQYEACMTATLAQFKELFGGLTCNTKPEEAPEFDLSGVTIEECEVIQTLCPSLNSDLEVQ